LCENIRQGVVASWQRVFSRGLAAETIIEGASTARAAIFTLQGPILSPPPPKYKSLYLRQTCHQHPHHSHLRLRLSQNLNQHTKQSPPPQCANTAYHEAFPLSSRNMSSFTSKRLSTRKPSTSSFPSFPRLPPLETQLRPPSSPRPFTCL
jgi:hypothetical protein